MNIFTKASFGKASFGLAVLAALTSAGAAHATGVIDVAPTVTAPAAGSNAPYQYSYAVTPRANDSSPESSLNFSFTDPNVTYVSNTGPLDVVTSTGPGSFSATSSGSILASPASTPGIFPSGPAAATLNPGSTETFVFRSLNGPQGTLSVVGISTGFLPDFSGPVVGPAAVPEASTTVSFGLLLMLGLGGAVIAARKKQTA